MNLYQIESYRAFIREILERRSPKRRGEIAKLAEGIGVHPTFVSQVLTGTKDFSLEQSYAIADYLSLSETERKYFLLLVQKDRAGSQGLKAFFKKELVAIRKDLLKVEKRLNSHRTLTDEQKAIFYSSGIYSAVRLYCTIADGKTPEQVAGYFKLPRVKAINILEFLVEANLCEQVGDRYRMLTALVTHLSPDSPYIIRHHMNWRTQALQRHENLSVEELAISAPMSISVKDFKEIREKLLSSIKDSLEIVKGTEPEDVAFLNVDFLWVKPRGE
jgi:uncharacterized protein (TIGR02147 family)